MNSFKNILVPLNFSDSSDNAVKTAIAMCKRHNATLHLLQVKKENNFVFPPGKNADVLAMTLEANKSELDDLESQAKAIERENSITCFYHTAEGSFYSAVSNTVEDFYCDLLILEKPSDSQIYTLIKRHSIINMIDHVKCPVLTVPGKRKYLNFKNVLLSIRPVLSGMDKFDMALPIIKKNGSKVLLFAPIGYKKKKTDLLTIKDLFNKADSLISHENLDAEKEINFTHDSAQEVVNKAVQTNSDLIVITATVKKGLMAFFTRTFTERIIANSPVPVLSVKLQ